MLKYKSIIEQMTLEEKAAMMSGKDTWQTVSYEKYGIPPMFLSDGPHGLRKQEGVGDQLGIHASVPATCYPTAATMANSWDEELGEELGRHLGAEAGAIGVNMILGPGLNIKRSPLCGRNFEYFSEDPYLSGKMAASYIRGIQETGAFACPKHFAANSQELRRMASDSIVDERTLRELYLTGFEIAVREGKAKGIMSAYNSVNGIYANENSHLLQDILVDEWGYDGMVVSDWGGSNDHVLGVQNGSHLEMPGTGKMGTRELVEGVKSGRLKEETLDRRLDELLSIIFKSYEKMQKYTNAKTSESFDEDLHHAFARKAARESIVLLKNENNILPLKPNTKVAVIGDFAKNPRFQGAGSSLVNNTKLDTALECTKQSGLILDAYAQGYERNKPTNQTLLSEAKETAAKAEYVLLYVGLDENSESEGLDREHMNMPQGQLDLIDAVTEVNHNVIVVLSAGSAILMPWIDKVKAVVHGYLGGQAGAGAMLDVLTGKYNPSGKLNESYPLSYEDTPAFRYFPGRERTSEYRESLYVGYRYYETAEVPVRFPFGYGLSYTSFSYSDLSVDKSGVTFTLTNTGSMDGAEIAQLYIGKKSSDIFRPVRELKGFKKIFLKAGESARITIPFDDKTFRYYNTKTDKWETEGGAYEISVGVNASHMVLTGSITVEGTDAPAPYDARRMPAYFNGKIQNIDDSQYECLLGRPIPDGHWNADGLLGANDAISQLYYAKSCLARLAYKILTHMKEKSEKKGTPDLNILFIYNMPFRGISKMTGGSVNMGMVNGILEIVNGHFFKGLGHLIKSTLKGA